MLKRTWMALLAVALCAQQPTPDLILTNGKIITVDERFSIAQAVAIRGDRIAAAGDVIKKSRNWRVPARAGST